MSSKFEDGYEEFGQADSGWSRPHRYFEFGGAGGDTAPQDLRAHPPRYIENPYTWSGWWEISRQCSINEFGNIRRMGSKNLTGMPVFDDQPYPEFGETTPKLLQKWRESRFELGVTIGEGREAAQLMADRLTGLAKAARSLRNKDLGGALRHLAKVPKTSRRGAQLSIGANELSKAWLELQYGWKPLINDIGALAEMIKLHPKENRIRARSSNRGGATLYSPSNLGNVQVFKNDRRLQQIVVVTSQPTLMERFGLTDPRSIAWELTPFSFVVDWFTPIGDYLKSIHAVNHMPVKEVIQTYSSLQSANVTVTSGMMLFGYLPVVQGGTTTSIIVSGQRSVFPTLPLAWMASIQVSREISNDMDPSLQRIVNGSALVQQQLVKLGRSL